MFDSSFWFNPFWNLGPVERIFCLVKMECRRYFTQLPMNQIIAVKNTDMQTHIDGFLQSQTEQTLANVCRCHYESLRYYVSDEAVDHVPRDFGSRERVFKKTDFAEGN